jgi:hypothetical protein
MLADLVDENNDQNPTPGLPLPMPDSLRDAGWRMSRIHGKFRARNEKLNLFSAAHPTPVEATYAAECLNHGMKEVIHGDGRITYEDPDHVDPAPVENNEGVADFSVSDDERETSPVEEATPDPAPALKREPTPERTFDDELAATRETLKDRPNVPRMVSHALIRLDGGTQPREKLDQSLILEYAEAKKRGDVFPPVDLFFDDEWMWLAGGFHRYFSDKLLGRDETLANVHFGTRRDAVLFSLSENATHGLPRSNAEKRRAVLTLLEDPEWSQWSDNVVAKKALVSQPFVSSIRRELTQNVLSERPVNHVELSIEDLHESIGMEETNPQPVPEPEKREPERATKRVKVVDRRRVGADGVVRDTSNIGRKVSAESARKNSLEELLNGRRLAVSFTWIPAVKGKVSVSVNMGREPSQALRNLISSDDAPKFPEPVLKMISKAIENYAVHVGRGGATYAEARPKKKATANKKPAPTKPAKKSAKKPAKKAPPRRKK